MDEKGETDLIPVGCSIEEFARLRGVSVEQVEAWNREGLAPRLYRTSAGGFAYRFGDVALWAKGRLPGRPFI